MRGQRGEACQRHRADDPRLFAPPGEPGIKERGANKHPASGEQVLDVGRALSDRASRPFLWPVSVDGKKFACICPLARSEIGHVTECDPMQLPGRLPDHDSKEAFGGGKARR